MTSPIALRRGGAVLVVGAALAFGTAACGDDEETGSVTTPSVPAQTDDTPTITEEATTEAESTDDDSGGVASPDETTDETENEGPDDSGGVGPSDAGDGRGDPARPDSPENDVAPEPGSPQEAFEQYCDANPDACG
jgi:hypothetical protein